MRITYDAEADALYIRFREAKVTTKHLDQDLAVDYDEEGHLAGIEILDVRHQLGGPETFRSVMLEDITLGRPSLSKLG